MHGNGLLKYEDGRFYQGEFAFDKKNGNGLFYWGDGRKYEGGWK